MAQRIKNWRRIPAAALALAAALLSGAATAQQPAGYVGILGGGPVYMHNDTNIQELQTAGFNELIVWSVEVGSTGDLNLNGEFPLTSNGKYIGDQKWPQFAQDLQTIKSGKVRRITFSIGSSNFGDFQNLKALVDSQGTGKKSILYKDFAALAAALPIDAIDLDDENSYDAESVTKFALMLGKLGLHVTMNPYTNAAYWTSLVAGINGKSPGLVDAIHLQTFAGGQGNSPCAAEWDFGGVPVYPGLSDQTSAPPYSSPELAKQRLAAWHAQCGITGGWLWIFDQIKGTDLPKQYAHKMIKGVSG
ncbi:MAG: hypothetical protein JO208_01400 [Alphaproteobacteria bacterium]|nr:hypothetical protein [Alphaproteobacteria bacterium]